MDSEYEVNEYPQQAEAPIHGGRKRRRTHRRKHRRLRLRKTRRN